MKRREKMKNIDFSQIVIIILGIYCLYRGFITLTTGKLTEREEAKLRDFSANGARKYRMLNAVSNLIGGVLTIGIALIRMFNLINQDVFRIAAIIIVAVLCLVYFLLWKACKNAK